VNDTKYDFSNLAAWAKGLLNSDSKGSCTTIPILSTAECLNDDIVSIKSVQIITCKKPYRLCGMSYGSPCNPPRVSILSPGDNSEYGLKMAQYKKVLFAFGVKHLYNPLKRWYRGLGMPTFRKIQWNDYTLQLIPHDRNRSNLLAYLNVVFVPYISGKELSFDSAISRGKEGKQKKFISSFKYEWSLYDENNNLVVNTNELDATGNELFDCNLAGYHLIKLFRWTLSKGEIIHNIWRTRYIKSHAIVFKVIPIIGRYNVKLRFYDEKDIPSEFETAAEFKLRDRDDYYWWMITGLFGIAGVVIGGVIGGVVGYFIGS
jgi:hypothetical protein